MADVDDLIGSRKVDTREQDRIVKDLKIARDNGELETHPRFQRNPGIWGLNKKVLLIESILANIPIPQIYVAETIAQDSRTVDEVIDGQQRLSTIFDYIDDKFKLSGLEIYEQELEGKPFKLLSPLLQDKILNRSLHMVKVLRTSDPDVKFAMFMRLNRGSVSLNRQELRECCYYSPLVEFVRELAQTPCFHKTITDAFNKQTILRRKAEELVAETLAFYALPEDSYRRKSGFIDTFYDTYKELQPDCEEFKQWHSIFTDSCLSIQRVFGRYPFRNLVDRDDNKSPRKFIESIFRIYMYNFMRFVDHKIAREHANELVTAFKQLYKNKEFLFSISSKGDENFGSRSSSDVYKVKKSLDFVKELVKNECQCQIPRLPDAELEALNQKRVEEQEHRKQHELEEWEARQESYQR